MIFDKLAKLVERFQPDLKTILDSAKLFIFPDVPHGNLPTTMQKEIFNGFFLPFPVTAVEDPASCVILVDSQPNQTGMAGPRGFIECVNLSAPHKLFYDGDDMERFKSLKDHYIVSTGQIHKIIHGNETEGNMGYEIDAKLTSINMYERDKLIQSSEDLLKVKDIGNGPAKNAVTAMEEVLLCGAPQHFVLESRPVKQGKTLKGKIIRSDNRPNFTILDPLSIRQKIQLPTGEGIIYKKKAHERRRHSRTLRSERYGANQGKKINIPATWVGPSENIVGNKRYKVRLDI